MLDTEDVTLGESLAPESCAEHWGRGWLYPRLPEGGEEISQRTEQKEGQKEVGAWKEHLFLHERIDKFVVKSSKERCPDPHPL